MTRMVLHSLRCLTFLLGFLWMAESLHGDGLLGHRHGGGDHNTQPPAETPSIDDFDSFSFSHERSTKTVYHYGAGPGVLLLHEIDGITPETLVLAQRIAKEGYSVFIPHLFGKPGIAGGQLGRARACLRRDFNCLTSQRSSTVIGWLRALVPVVAEKSSGHGVAVIGMCLTGSFPVALMDNPLVRVVVLSQPSVPFPLNRRTRAALGLSQQDIDRAKARTRRAPIRMLAFRFTNDPISPPEKFDTLEKLFCDTIQLREFAPENRENPHAVLTVSFVPEAFKLLIDALRQELNRT